MGITEPTGWGADCDRPGCRAQQDQEDDVRDWDDWVDTLRQSGWIVVLRWTFCDLDCLLTRRSEQWFRELMASSAALHARCFHTPDACCPGHGHHSADGIHDRGCPKRRAAR